MTSNKPILVTGPAGNTGRVIVDELQQRRVPFFAMTHNKQRLHELVDRNIATRYGNFDNPTSLDSALTGIDTAYLVCTPDERLVHREVNFINAAKKMGVKHIVNLSAHLADINSPSPNLQSHGVVEQSLKNSGIEYTFVRPGGYMQTWAMFTWALLSGRKKFGILSMPGGDGKIPLVDVRNVAQVALKALLDPEEHAGKTHIVTGLVAMGYAEHAEIWSKALEKPVEYQSTSERQFKMVMAGLGVKGAPAKHVTQIFKWQRNGELAEVFPTLKDLDIPCTTFEQFVNDWISGHTGGGNSFEEKDSLRVRAINASFLTAMSVRFFFKNAFGSSK